MINFLLDQIEYTAIWRYEKAGEYPDDAVRNEGAAKALNKLHEYIKKLPIDHELSTIMDEAMDEARDNNDALEWVIKEENDLIRTYGFQRKEDPEGFVNDLISIYKGSRTK